MSDSADQPGLVLTSTGDFQFIIPEHPEITCHVKVEPDGIIIIVGGGEAKLGGYPGEWSDEKKKKTQDLFISAGLNEEDAKRTSNSLGHKIIAKIKEMDEGVDVPKTAVFPIELTDDKRIKVTSAIHRPGEPSTFEMHLQFLNGDLSNPKECDVILDSTEILTPRIFRIRVFDKLKIIPPNFDTDRWIEKLNEICEVAEDGESDNLGVHEVKLSQFVEWVNEFHIFGSKEDAWMGIGGWIEGEFLCIYSKHVLLFNKSRLGLDDKQISQLANAVRPLTASGKGSVSHRTTRKLTEQERGENPEKRYEPVTVWKLSAKKLGITTEDSVFWKDGVSGGAEL